MRYKYQNTFQAGSGQIIPSGTVTVYLADGTTLATIYEEETGGAATGSTVTSGTDGTFEFWVDTSDYTATQQFKIVLSKTGFTSKTYDDILIFPNIYYQYIVDPGEADHGVTGDGATIKAYVDSIGSNTATIYLQGGTYTLLTSETTPSNVTLKIDPGATIDIDAGATLTVDGPVEAGEYAIFTGTGAVTIASTTPGFSKWTSTATMTLTEPGLHLPDTDASHDLILKCGSNLLNERILQFITGDSGRSITLSGNPTLADWFDQAVKAASSPTFAGLTLGTTAGLNVAAVPGLVVRGTFAYSSTTAITINPAMYHHSGTTEQLVYWDSALTFTFGSGGSNASSDNLGVTEWHCLFIDDSAVVTAGTNVITASELRNDTTPGTWSDAKHGYYTGNDRMIAMWRTDGSSQLIIMEHSGDLLQHEDIVTDINTTDVDTTFVDCTFDAPAIDGLRLRACVLANYSGGDGGHCFWRKNGSTVSTGNRISDSSAGSTANMCVDDVIIDSTKKIEVKMQNSTASTMTVWGQGVYFPEGM